MKTNTNLFKEISDTSIASSNQRLFAFHHLSEFADYLLSNKVAEMAARQYELSKELEIPLLRYFSHLPDDQIIALGAQDIRKVLTALQQNQVSKYIRDTVAVWVSNQIPEFSRNQLLSDDISLLSYIRRKLFREFVSNYTKDIGKIILVLDEMDKFITSLESVMVKTLFTIQQELHEQSQETARLGNWLWDLASNHITWSRELFRIYELEQTEHVTFDISLYNHPDDNDLVMEQMRMSRETNQPHDFFYRIILPSGKEKYLHARGQVLTGESGLPERMYGTLQDVTEQKLNEKIHRDYEHFIQKITDLTPSLITVYNVKTGKYLFLNQALDTLLGYDPKQALELGMDFFLRITHPDDLRRIQEENNDALNSLNTAQDMPLSDQIREFRYRLRHSNGDYRWFHTYGTIFERDRNNDIEKVINISNDITDQIANKSLLHQQTEEITSYTFQLEEKNRELGEKNKELESFAYVASHDLQEPLRKIKIWCSRLFANNLTPDLVLSGLTKIQDSSTKMQALIEGLLQYTQLEDAKPIAEKIDLNTVLQEVLDDFSEGLEEREAVVTKPELPAIVAIRLQMQQLFSNLISNSIKYSTPKIPLRITVGYSLVTSEDRSSRKYHQITFTDNGLGFEQDHSQKIFEIFQRLGNSRNSGTGIGLAICKKIVENHGGSIRAVSAPGKGSTFYILLAEERFNAPK